jgi:hypothetical protein
MKRLLQSAALVVLLGILFVLGWREIPVHIYDGFESSTLSWIRWSHGRFVKDAVVPEQEFVRSGHRALALTVRNGDHYEAASDIGAATERDELMESWWLYSHMGRTYVYSFSLYLPKDFPLTSERLVLAQWRQLCEARRCRPDYPILALRYDAGRIKVNRKDEKGTDLLYQGEDDIRGRWLDFRFVTRFDPTANGAVDATLNGQSIVHYRGPTTFQPAHGYPEHGLVYFKTGLYRDALGDPPWTIYVDEYRKDECRENDCK